ncbi:MAG: DUF4397 domain-containing protein [Chloroflexota bacterium]
MMRGPGPYARLRVLNASPDVPSLDVRVDGSQAFSSVSYGQLTDYVNVDVGQRTVTLYAAEVASPTPLVSVAINMRNEAEATVALVGRAGEMEALVIDDVTPPAAPGRVRIRMLNLAPDPPMDLYIKDGVDIFRNVAYKVVTGYAETSVGTVDLELRPADGRGPTMTIDDYRLEPGGRYTLIVLGRRPAARAFDVLPVRDRGEEWRGPERRAA